MPVAVTKAVCEAVGTISVAVSVIGTKGVFVGIVVSTKVGGIGVEVNVQANEGSIHKITKINFRLI
jgi:hypothetical protein